MSGSTQRLSKVEIAICVEVYPYVFSDVTAFDLFRHVGTDAVD